MCSEIVFLFHSPTIVKVFWMVSLPFRLVKYLQKNAKPLGEEGDGLR